ncbi:GntR family transcriptional regulator, phosphonate transport system regulatory protein [Andreprevotia lacus DSM 23236]|uniref:GntR family transcriptional regulator, phosphonate transport system regulatory protein n=1 Tax=Andreprevotia lacus DSM 23236 TaxID=1121001 RepID=A0A1W1XGM1_9NEIS|nr:phosphonate metabolism transcriptional regulator PhnF [Andreprevotia lacus]SMC23133.1 GntR family transcriptional regulator, phosphonate transport system regulatory protein [Andreprevotia lacus DSM 23236]
MVERGSGVSLWRQIEETLAADIAAKTLRERLPNEIELAGRFGVNRHTIRRAVQALEGRGLVRIEQGRGTFVQEDLIDYRLGHKSRFTHSLQTQRLTGGSRVLGHDEVIARENISSLLELPAHSRVLKVESLDLVDERVVGVCTQYFPLPRFAGFAEPYAESGSTVLTLREFGIVECRRKLSRVTARLPKPEVAQQLAQPKTQPILYVESVYADADGVPIEYGITRFAGDAIQLFIEPEQ